jgi:hypothetical protein
MTSEFAPWRYRGRARYSEVTLRGERSRKIGNSI